MVTYCAPLLTDFFLYSNEAEFMQKLLHEKKRFLAVAFNRTFRQIDYVLSDNDNFHSYVNTTYPCKLKVKDTTVFRICFLFRYVVKDRHRRQTNNAAL
jgi:hypothetical protein